MIRIQAVALLVILLAASSRPVAAQTPTPATPTQTAPTPTVQPATPAAPPTPVPVTVLSRSFSLSGTLVVDADGDQRLSVGDTAPTTNTLVQLIPVEANGVPGAELLTAPDGSFSFTEIPAREYTLWVWWGPGFINVPSAPTNTGLFQAQITVAADGTVSGNMPSQLPTKPLKDATIPYPVATGAGQDGPLPIGAVSLRRNTAAPAAPAARPATTLPQTGSGKSATSNLPLAVGLSLVAFALLIGIGVSLRSRRAR
jgi:hypothetical protein